MHDQRQATVGRDRLVPAETVLHADHHHHVRIAGAGVRAGGQGGGVAGEENQVVERAVARDPIGQDVDDVRFEIQNKDDPAARDVVQIEKTRQGLAVVEARPAQLVPGSFRNGTLESRGAIESGVMEHDHRPVFGEADVGLDEGDSRRDGPAHAFKAVLGDAAVAVGAVGDGERARATEIAQAGGDGDVLG